MADTSEAARDIHEERILPRKLCSCGGVDPDM